MKILFIGDIVAKPGRQAVKAALPGVLTEEKPDLVIANAENLAHGRGATAGTIQEMMDVGVDFFTGGDHLFWHKDFEKEIADLPVIRPANYPENVPGRGWAVLDTTPEKVLVVNMMGQTFIEEPISNPFSKIDEILSDSSTKDVSVKVIDFHGEATSDKLAFGFYLDGKVDAVIGTHTHIPTCDERVLPNGTMFVSDIGMTGNIDSVLGVKKEIIIDRMANAKKQKFEWEEVGRQEFRSVLINTETKEIRRVDKKLYRQAELKGGVKK